MTATNRQTRAERATAMRTERDARVLEAALAAAVEHGYQWITRDDVAARAGVSNATVSNAYGDMVDLKRRVLREAVARPVLAIVAQGLADRHAIALDAPPHVKEQALATLTD